MDNFQITGSERFDTQMSAHTVKYNTVVSLALEFQKHLSNASRKHDTSDHGKYKIISSKQNWKNREYHVQHNKYVIYQYANIYCATKQFSGL